MTLLCYSGTRGEPFGGYDRSGVHLTLDERETLCGRAVIDIPVAPRGIEPLSCRECYEVAAR